MSSFYDLSKTPRKILNQAIVKNIVAESNGAWLDPSDMTTLYQDAAGTTPVTAVEQPVGKILDKSGNGYHATQSITASRPTLSARKNILLATETLATQSVTTLAAQYTLSFTGTGSVTLSGTATGTLTGNGTDRVSLTVTPTAGTLTLTVSGSVTKAQLELGASAGPYQRVNTATDYDTDPRYFPKYLRFDGVDDYMNLPYMGLYAGGSASVVAGVNTTNLSAFAVLLSERNTAATNAVYILARNERSSLLDALIRDDAISSLLDSTGVSGLLNDNISRVLSVIDNGGDLIINSNSQQKQSNSYSRATRTLTLNTTTIGASVSTTTGNYASMKLYGLIITKSALSDAQRIKCERYAASKAGVML